MSGYPGHTGSFAPVLATIITPEIDFSFPVQSAVEGRETGKSRQRNTAVKSAFQDTQFSVLQLLADFQLALQPFLVFVNVMDQLNKPFPQVQHFAVSGSQIGQIGKIIGLSFFSPQLPDSKLYVKRVSFLDRGSISSF